MTTKRILRVSQLLIISRHKEYYVDTIVLAQWTGYKLREDHSLAGELMEDLSIRGVFAALLLSRDRDGSLIEPALANQLEFLLSRGIRNFAFNGATSEYCQATPAELSRCLQISKTILPSDASILCGIGAASLRDTLKLGEIAIRAEVLGLLVPAPHFFPYSQSDLVAFVEAVAVRLPLPQLLYNLPQFTTGFEPATALDLVRRCSNIVGTKDSSGSLDTLRLLTRETTDTSRIIGNDGVLAQALLEDICNGVVSGVACVLPEIIQALFAHPPASPSFTSAADHLREIISHINVLPTPWGLKVLAEERGITQAVYPLPLSRERELQIHSIREWFREWLARFEESQSVKHTGLTN